MPVTTVTTVTPRNVTEAVVKTSRVRGRAVAPAGLPVATQDQFDTACERYGRGEHWNDIGRDMGIDWGMFARRGGVEGNVERFNACQMSNKVATLKRIGERAEHCAFNGERRKSVTVTKAGGPPETTETVERYADPAMARIALEVAAPDIHGKLAGSKTPTGPVQAVQVTINMVDRRRDVDDPDPRPTVTISGNQATTGCGGAAFEDADSGELQAVE